MSIIARQAESLRHRLLQPLADLLVVHATANPFAVAATLVGASAALQGALDVHRFVTSGWSALLIVADAVPIAVALGLAQHLVAFQRKADRTRFVVVHPLLRTLEPAAFGFGTVSLLLLPVAASSALAVGGSASETWWGSCSVLASVVGAAGLLIGACEWRRLPPARRREATIGTVPSPGAA